MKLIAISSQGHSRCFYRSEIVRSMKAGVAIAIQRGNAEAVRECHAKAADAYAKYQHDDDIFGFGARTQPLPSASRRQYSSRRRVKKSKSDNFSVGVNNRPALSLSSRVSHASVSSSVVSLPSVPDVIASLSRSVSIAAVNDGVNGSQSSSSSLSVAFANVPAKPIHAVSMNDAIVRCDIHVNGIESVPIRRNTN